MAKPIDMQAIRSSLSDFTIPPRPDMINQLQQEMVSDELSLKRIATIIQHDIGISGFTLKVVNSPLFSLPRKITSIEHACMFLGLPRVIRLVNSVMLKFTLSEGKENAFTQRLWSTSTNVASAAMALAQHLELGDDMADDLYSIGFFHNAGMALILDQNSDYPDIVKKAYSQNDITISEYETKEYRASHDLLGFLLAQTWGLTAQLSNVIAYHHSPLVILATGQPKEKQMLALLKLAEHMTGQPELLSGCKVDVEWAAYGERLLRFLGLQSTQLPEIGEALNEKGVGNIYHR
jgi:HD-like signal output (HDOD) protein